MTKILIVDDEVDILITLKDALEYEGPYTVKTVSDSRNALARALEFRHDLVILDIKMPYKDGGQVASEMRDTNELRDVPVLFLTAVMSRDEEMHQHAYAEQEHILIKPVSIDKIIETIQKLTA